MGIETHFIAANPPAILDTLVSKAAFNEALTQGGWEPESKVPEEGLTLGDMFKFFSGDKFCGYDVELPVATLVQKALRSVKGLVHADIAWFIELNGFKIWRYNGWDIRVLHGSLVRRDFESRAASVARQAKRVRDSVARLGLDALIWDLMSSGHKGRLTLEDKWNDKKWMEELSKLTRGERSDFPQPPPRLD